MQFQGNHKVAIFGFVIISDKKLNCIVHFKKSQSKCHSMLALKLFYAFPAERVHHLRYLLVYFLRRTQKI